MSLDSFRVLVGLQLSILRRAPDMLVLHFGDIRVHLSGKGTVGTYALHAQCAWRFDGPGGTITGRDDLWAYAGPGERPPNGSYEDGFSLQDRQFSKFFIRDECTRSWVNPGDRFIVTGTEQTKDGDLRLDFTEGYAIRLFPSGSGSEAWRLFEPGSDDDHVVFPTTQRDYGISRRKAARVSELEVWMKILDAEPPGKAMQAPPTLIVTADGTRYRCGRCGTVLALAEVGALKDLVIHCRECDRYNEVPL
jgi:hypothetical protein